MTFGPVISFYSTACIVTNLAHFVYLNIRGTEQEKQKAFHKLTQATLYLTASQILSAQFCACNSINYLSIDIGAALLFSTGIIGYREKDWEILNEI